MAWSWEGALAGFADPSYGARALLERQKAEAEAQQRQQILQSFGVGSPLEQIGQQADMQAPQNAGDSYLAKLGNAYSMTGDPRFLQQITEYQSPDAELDRTVKRAQVENQYGQNWLQQYDIEQKKRELENRQRVFGTGNPDFGTPQQMQQQNGGFGIPVDNMGARGEDLGIPNISQIASKMQSMLGGQPQTSAYPTVTPVETQELPPPPAYPIPSNAPQLQPPPAAPAPSGNVEAEPVRLLNIDEWAQSTPEGQAARQAGDLDKYYSSYADYAKNFRNMQQEAEKARNTVEKPTEANQATANFVNRMIAAENKLSELPEGSEAGRTGAAGYVEQTLAALPLGSFGDKIGEGIVKMAATPQQQVYLKNAEDWIRAKLRKESGAVIGPDEMAAEYASYFPMPGDSNEVLADKADRRRIAIQSMQIAAGPVKTPQQLNQEKTIQTPAGNVTFRVIGQ